MTQFEEGTLPVNLPEGLRDDAIFLNDIYQVNVRRMIVEGMGRCVHLSIKRRDRQPVTDWRDIQWIKNQLVGPEVEAVQLFPAESRLVDTSNQFHIFCFPDIRFPFGFDERLVSETPLELVKGQASVQRPFAEYVRPVDLEENENRMNGMVAKLRRDMATREHQHIWRER